MDDVNGHMGSDFLYIVESLGLRKTCESTKMQETFVATVFNGLSNRNTKRVAEVYADEINKYLKGFRGKWSYQEITSDTLPPFRTFKKHIAGSWSPNIARSNAVVNPLRKTLKNIDENGTTSYSYVFATKSQTRAYLKLLESFKGVANLMLLRQVVIFLYCKYIVLFTVVWTLLDIVIFFTIGTHNWINWTMLTVAWIVHFFVLWNLWV